MKVNTKKEKKMMKNVHLEEKEIINGDEKHRFCVNMCVYNLYIYIYIYSASNLDRT